MREVASRPERTCQERQLSSFRRLLNGNNDVLCLGDGVPHVCPLHVFQADDKTVQRRELILSFPIGVGRKELDLLGGVGDVRGRE